MSAASLIRIFLFVVLTVTLAEAANGQSRQAPAVWAPGISDQELGRDPAAPAGLHQRFNLGLAERLPPAALSEMDRLEELIAHNLSSKIPMQVGITRMLPEPQELLLDYTSLEGPFPRTANGGLLDWIGERLVWSAQFQVEWAHGLRLYLDRGKLPDSTRIWVFDSSGQRRGPQVIPRQTAGGIWTPTIFDDTVIVEIDVLTADLEHGEPLELSIDRMGEIFRLDREGVPYLGEPEAEPQSTPECFVDGMCRDSGDLGFIEDYRKAVANLVYPVGGQCCFTCTGGLIASTEGPGAYLLTANHCFSTPESAVNLDAFWDHVTDECDGSDPGLSGVPRTEGSTLLATSSDTDFTLGEITEALPSGRYHLGWTAEPQADNTELFRLHHPGTNPQYYSRSVLQVPPPSQCGGLPAPRYLYSQLQEGGQAGGSSGSVVVIDNKGGQIVGQLFGVCGSNLGDRCDYDSNLTVDGAFAFTHFTTRQWLDPDQHLVSDSRFNLPNINLEGSQSVQETFTCDSSQAGEVIAFTFSGQFVGSGNSLPSDLRLQLSGPSGSSFDVGGFDNLDVPWAFQTDAPVEDGTYYSSHISVFGSEASGTTICEGTWTAEFSNDVSGNDAVDWTDISITLHRLDQEEEVIECPHDDDLVIEDENFSGTELREACKTITAGPDVTVESTGDLTLRAGEHVALKPGFSVERGGVLTIEMTSGLAQ